jgi:hypothetical protein
VRTVRDRVVSLPLGKPRGLDNNRMTTWRVPVVKDDVGLKSLPVSVSIAKFAGGNVVGIVTTLIGDHADVPHTI